jgi:YidC/Oxa1 family membrane protein insertase
LNNKIIFVIASFVLLLVLGGCSGTTVPITAESTGFWDHYFVYSFSVVIKFAAVFFQDNYGLAIIAVTLIIRLFLLPLSLSQSKSQVKMRAIQPEMKALREKYNKKKDKDSQIEMQQEMMQLYKKHGINPLQMGCLPMLIQMPILMAFYYAIMRTHEIATHNFLWFNLGAADPLHILPVIAAFTTFIQFKVMNIGMEQVNPQSKLMGYIMPGVIFLTALNFPAALPLYWIVGNIFVIIQTYFINKQKLPQTEEL